MVGIGNPHWDWGNLNWGFGILMTTTTDDGILATMNRNFFAIWRYQCNDFWFCLRSNNCSESQFAICKCKWQSKVVTITVNIISAYLLWGNQLLLAINYHVVPIGIETLGSFGPHALDFIKDIDHRIAESTGEKKSTSYLMQIIGIAIQRGNSSCILETSDIILI